MFQARAHVGISHKGRARGGGPTNTTQRLQQHRPDARRWHVHAALTIAIDFARGKGDAPDSFSVKTESEDASRPTSPSPSNTRWNKRKRAFKLKLDNLAPKPKRAYVLAQQRRMLRSLAFAFWRCTYDFENVEYDYPPPGSPPLPSAYARPNEIGNSNGQIPDFELDASRRPRGGWLKRTIAAALPASVSQRVGLAPRLPAGVVGGGLNNDGVFANVTAKPAAPRAEVSDELTSAEDSRSEAPPSYASAQADAVPPYWETTVHAPFAPDSLGEMIIDNLPTGSLFSFLWNMLVSISFQFVGFLLTYLLHTTHAARLGSRAGLGVTLIQYGLALREEWRTDSRVRMPGQAGMEQPLPVHATLTEEEQAAALMANATTEWLSFFLMTVGWFILLTSLLGFLRVKRWERGILNSQQNTSTTPAEPTIFRFPLFPQVERNFGFSGFERMDLLRRGLGLGSRQQPNDIDEESEVLAANQTRRTEDGSNDTPRNPRHGEDGGRDDDGDDATELDMMIPLDSNRVITVREAMERDRRLQADLREAGLI
ncbi:Metal homeostatis protein [Salix suchowensis]|nr:Metal homeostatis protein [Salix suchowensis]